MTAHEPDCETTFLFFYICSNNWRLRNGLEGKRNNSGHNQAYTYDEVSLLIRFEEGFLVGGVIPNPIDAAAYGLKINLPKTTTTQ